MAGITKARCPRCEEVVRFDKPRAPGAKVRCPHCDSSFSLPEDEPHGHARSKSAHASEDDDELAARLVGRSRDAHKVKKGAAARARRKQRIMVVGGILLVLALAGLAVGIWLSSEMKKVEGRFGYLGTQPSIEG